jgi:hypothetical protein
MKLLSDSLPKQRSGNRVCCIYFESIQTQIALTTLKGKVRIAPMTLNTTPNVSPTILKGKSINQTIGKRNKAMSARGQQRINNRHQSIIARKVRIAIYFITMNANDLPNLKYSKSQKIY